MLFAGCNSVNVDVDDEVGVVASEPFELDDVLGVAPGSWRNCYYI
jgi:hypothetical protein